jgi:hypothetical protein
MIQSKTGHKRPGIQLGYLRKESGLGKQNGSWERDLVRLQKKLRNYAGQRSVTDELIRERRNEA